jgi:hypothetical protein
MKLRKHEWIFPTRNEKESLVVLVGIASSQGRSANIGSRYVFHVAILRILQSAPAKSRSLYVQNDSCEQRHPTQVIAMVNYIIVIKTLSQQRESTSEIMTNEPINWYTCHLYLPVVMTNVNDDTFSRS